MNLAELLHVLLSLMAARCKLLSAWRGLSSRTVPGAKRQRHHGADARRSALGYRRLLSSSQQASRTWQMALSAHTHAL